MVGTSEVSSEKQRRRSAHCRSTETYMRTRTKDYYRNDMRIIIYLEFADVAAQKSNT